MKNYIMNISELYKDEQTTGVVKLTSDEVTTIILACGDKITNTQAAYQCTGRPMPKMAKDRIEDLTNVMQKMQRVEKTFAEKIDNGGYLTHALTDGESTIYGLVKNCKIFAWRYESKHLYWSEVYVEPNDVATIIRKGELIHNMSDGHLQYLHEVSKINLGSK